VHLQYVYKGETVRITVIVSSIYDDQEILERQTISASEFGALALEQTFGRAPTNEHIFASDSGGFEGCLGPVRGDIEGGMIEVLTPQVRLTMEGTYLGEAGILLTQAWRVVSRLMHQVAEGVQSLHLCFQPDVCEAVVASPVKFTIGVPNLDELGDTSAEEVIAAGLARALQNKTRE
jgi:hypothetical protein